MKNVKQIPIKTKSIKKIYQNPWLSLEEHKVINADNKEGVYGVLNYGNGVSILAMDDKNNIFLIKEYKYAVKKFMFQLPSGGVGKGEKPIQSAKRELLEETGLKASDWKHLGITNPFPTTVTTTVSLYLATNLKQIKKPEVGVDLYKFSIQEVIKMISRNEITHSGSIVCLFKYLQFNRSGILSNNQ